MIPESIGACIPSFFSGCPLRSVVILDALCGNSSFGVPEGSSNTSRWEGFVVAEPGNQQKVLQRPRLRAPEWAEGRDAV